MPQKLGVTSAGRRDGSRQSSVIDMIKEKTGNPFFFGAPFSGMTPAFCAKQLGRSVEVFLRTYVKWLDGGKRYGDGSAGEFTDVPGRSPKETRGAQMTDNAKDSGGRVGHALKRLRPVISGVLDVARGRLPPKLPPKMAEQIGMSAGKTNGPRYRSSSRKL
ncbi:hypothetical protein [Caballeronia mineralivorans]|uniref:hypothetical protein n=1 Tax=Caballeronia mineralivorans TaxID=2010198 RepID=UPI000AF3647A|nr:hypothetical protein [Caballeronia mineralivorans]